MRCVWRGCGGAGTKKQNTGKMQCISSFDLEVLYYNDLGVQGIGHEVCVCVCASFMDRMIQMTQVQSGDHE